jgi:uncharacterized repeat protein (TIGR03803 family)
MQDITKFRLAAPHVDGIGLCALVTAAFIYAGGLPCARAQVKESLLHTFKDNSRDLYARGPLLVDSTGTFGSARGLYGFGAASVFRLQAPENGQTTWKYSALRKLRNVPGQPYWVGLGGLFSFTERITPDTALYGTTVYGGKNKDTCLPNNAYHGCGTVFSLTGDNLTTIWDFTGGSDGGRPLYGVIADKSGALYTGTDSGGGVSNCGAIVKLSPPVQGQTVWTETTLWTFTNGSDGCAPVGLAFDRAGTLYGEAAGGSGNSVGGTVFKLVPPSQARVAWTEQTLWTFQGSGDGYSPYGPPTVGKDGVIYGTTIAGGNAGKGTVFALTPPSHGSKAWSEQILWNFTGGADGSSPSAAVIVDKAGAVYGTASQGGSYTPDCTYGFGCGTVFKLTPPSNGQTAWTETTLIQFFGGPTGAYPSAPLTADKAGTLYGTTEIGGPLDYGIAFSLAGTGFVP